MASHGSMVYRHDNTHESAMQLIDHFVKAEGKMTLDIQEEMVDQHKSLDGTAAAAIVDAQLERERERFIQELHSLKTELENALSKKDNDTAKLIREIRAENEAELEKVTMAQKRLCIEMEKLYDERYTRLEELEKSQMAASKTKMIKGYIDTATVTLTDQAHKFMAATERLKMQWGGQNMSSEDVWDARTNTSVSTFESHRDPAHCVALSHDWTRIASALGDHTVKIWDAASDQCVLTISRYDGQATSVVWSHDGKQLAVVLDDKTVNVWDTTTGQCVSTFNGHHSWSSSVAWWQDETDDTPVVFWAKGKTVKLWHMAEGQRITTLNGYKHLVDLTFWSHNWTQFASVSRNNTIKILDTATGQCMSTLEGHADRISSVAWSHDQTQLASASDDKAVKIWDVATGRCISTLEIKAVVGVASLAWSHDGTKLASGTCTGTIDIWDIATGKCVSMLRDDSNTAISSVVWSHDGTQIASMLQDFTFIIWNVATTHTVSKFVSHLPHEDGDTPRSSDGHVEP